MSNNQLKILLAVALVVIGYLLVQPESERHYSEQEVNNINSALSNRFNQSKAPAKKSLPMGHPATNSTSVNNNSVNLSMTKKPVANQQQSQANQILSQSMPNSDASSGQQSIVAIIYKRQQSTWFIKAKDTIANIDRVTLSFKDYFMSQLKFDSNDRPILSHIPENMQAPNTSNMRVATFMLDGVEISVSQLAGQQNVFANVKRWMGQVGLDDNSAIQLDFSDDKKTIFVRLPRPK